MPSCILLRKYWLQRSSSSYFPKNVLRSSSLNVNTYDTQKPHQPLLLFELYFMKPFVTYHPTQVGRLPVCILPNHSKQKCFSASVGNGPFPCVLRKPTLHRVLLEFLGKCYSNWLLTSRLFIIIYLLYSQLCFMLYREFREFRPRKT